MEKIELKPVREDEIELLHKMQVESFMPLYEKYHDAGNPAIETMDRVKKRAQRPILLFEKDDRIMGWIHFCHLEEDNYAGTYAFCIEDGTAEAIDEFTEMVRAQYPECELYMGFSKNNTEAVSELRKSGFECIEESYNDILDFKNYCVHPESTHVVRVDADNYRLFSDIHAQYNLKGMPTHEIKWATEGIFEYESISEEKRAMSQSWRLSVMAKLLPRKTLLTC